MLATFFEIVKNALTVVVFGMAFSIICRFAYRAHRAIKSKTAKSIILNFIIFIVGSWLAIYLACAITHINSPFVNIPLVCAEGADESNGFAFGKIMLLIGFAYIMYLAIKELLKFNYRDSLRLSKIDSLLAMLFLWIVVISTLGYLFITSVMPILLNL